MRKTSFVISFYAWIITLINLSPAFAFRWRLRSLVVLRLYDYGYDYKTT